MSEYPTFVPTLYYQDPKSALAWLERAFGFETTMLIEGSDGDDSRIHSEMKFGSGVIFVGGQWNDSVKSPKSIGGQCTGNVNVQLDADLDAHFERARQAGAVVVQEPENQFYGHRTYRVLDLEGHSWSFAQELRAMSNDEMAAAGGVSVKSTL